MSFQFFLSDLNIFPDPIAFDAFYALFGEDGFLAAPEPPPVLCLTLVILYRFSIPALTRAAIAGSLGSAGTAGLRRWKFSVAL